MGKLADELARRGTSASLWPGKLTQPSTFSSFGIVSSPLRDELTPESPGGHGDLLQPTPSMRVGRRCAAMARLFVGTARLDPAKGRKR